MRLVPYGKRFKGEADLHFAPRTDHDVSAFLPALLGEMGLVDMAFIEG